MPDSPRSRDAAEAAVVGCCHLLTGLPDWPCMQGNFGTSNRVIIPARPVRHPLLATRRWMKRTEVVVEVTNCWLILGNTHSKLSVGREESAW